MVNRVGVEPTTVGLKGHRSTTELPIHAGWESRTRTCDIENQNLAFCQLNYLPKNGEPSEIRTLDILIKSQAL